MLQRLRVKNFKLLRDVELELDPRVPTVLIGPNSSGKSTVLQVLDFLAHCAEEGFESAVTTHGGVMAMTTLGSREPIEIEIEWRFPESVMRWELSFHGSSHGVALIRREDLRFGDRVGLATQPDGQRVVVDQADQGAAPTPVISPRQLAFEAIVDPQRFKILGALRIMLRDIVTMSALTVAPSWARSVVGGVSPRDSVVPSSESYVGPDGSGLANALNNLQIDHPEAWEQLLRALRGEFSFIKRLVFPPDPAGGRISFAIDDARFPGRLVYASELSDGLIAFLSLLLMIVHPEQSGVLALDEPDAHLHPSAVRRLLALAHQPERFGRRIVIVTHSNAVLEQLADPAASIRIVDASAKGTRIRKLDADALAAWREEYTMTELRQTGLLDPSNTSYGNDE